MKKLILLLLFPFMVSAQNFNVSINSDASAFTDNATSIGIEAELDMKYVYAKIGVENTSLPINYFDFHGGIGGSVPINKVRIHSGIRLGKIWRGNGVTVPLFGLESGVAYKVADRISVGIYGTYDYRTEGDFMGYDTFWQGSGKIKIVYKINNLK